MAEPDDPASADEAVDLRNEARPLPAKPPVIAVAPAEADDAAPVREAGTDTIDSSLVGEGGLPAAAPRSEAGTTATADVPSDLSAEQPVVADAPDPGPTAGTAGPPPVLVSPTSPPSARRGGFWPLFLGGVAAAAIGSAATIWALPNLPGNLRPLPPAPEAPFDEASLRAEAASAAQAEVAARTDALLAGARQAGAEAGTEAARNAIAEAVAASPGADDTAADLEAAQQLQAGLVAIGELSSRVEALESRPAAAETPATTGSAPAGDVAALRYELAAQAQQLQALAAQPRPDPAALEEVRALADSAATTQQQIEAAAAAVEQRLAAAESGAAAVEQQVAEAVRRTEALAAIASLESALQSGGDRTAAVQGLEAAGVEAPDALATPAPSLEELQQGFPDAARAGLRASLREGSAAGGSMVTNFLRAQTGARSVEPRPGDDPDAVLSRAGDAVGRGDIPAALTELAALAPEGREAMADWLRGAEAWAAAADALGQIEGNLK